MSKPHSGRRRILKIAAVQLAAVVILLEVGLQLYQPLPFRVRGDEIVLPVRHVYRFDNGRTSKLDPVTVHTKNSLGFRGPEPPRDFRDRLTLVTIGGSTTESLFLSDGRTWTDEIARRLDAALPGIWVNNAGIDGHSTFGHLILLRSVIVDMRPQVAVFLVGANDVGLHDLNTFDAGVLPGGGVRRAVRTFVTSRSEVAGTAQNLLRAARARQRGLGHSVLDLHAVEELTLDPEVMDTTEAMYRASVPAYGARLRSMAALTRQAGIDAVWITQPALFGRSIDPETGVDLARVKVSGRGNGALEWRLLEMYNDETRRVAAEEGIFLIDLARALPKSSRYFYDFLHFTNEGSEAVGRIVAAHLEPYLLARPGADAK